MRNPKNQFESGHTGRPRGTRNKLQADFLRDLAEAWALEGPAALRIMIAEHPSDFVRVCASLMPREVSLDIGGPLTELSDDELLEALQQVRELRARTIEAEAADVSERALITESKQTNGDGNLR
jgi:hypothetical protein